MASSRPNIVLCLCDQLQVFTLGCYGNSFVKTPNIDRFASSGVRFEIATANFPVCMASRSSVLSGQFNRTCTGGIGNVQYPSFPGNYNMPEYPFAGRLHLRDKTMPEYLRDDAGYHTAAIGKWHIHTWPHDIGFEEYVIPRVHHCHSAQHYTENGGPEFVPDGWSLDYEVERAGRFFQERKQSPDRPFFLYFNISPPHCPVADIPEEFRTMYDPGEISFRGNVDTTADQRNDWVYQASVYRHDFRSYGLQLPYTLELPENYGLPELAAEYLGAVSWVDAAFGRLLDHIEKSGLAEDTIVVFSADHGDFLGSHGRFQKGQPHEESARVPMIWRWPAGYPAGEVRDSAVVSLLDLAPTFLTEAGLANPDHMAGESLAHLLRDEAVSLHDNWRIIESGRGAAIRTPTHTLALDFLPDKSGFAAEPYLFFDNISDPLQMRNLAGTGEQSPVFARLREVLEHWNRETPWMS